MPINKLLYINQTHRSIEVITTVKSSVAEQLLVVFTEMNGSLQYKQLVKFFPHLYCSTCQLLLFAYNQSTEFSNLIVLCIIILTAKHHTCMIRIN